MKKIAVIGAGVNGLSAATQVAEAFWNVAEVTLISDELSPNTTGDGSAGLFTPYLVEATPDDKIIQWSQSTFKFFRDLWIQGLAKDCGISLVPCIKLTLKPEGHIMPVWSHVVFGYEELNEAQLNRLRMEHGKPYTGGAQYVTFNVEPTSLLPYLYKRFEQAGGKFERRKIFKFDEIDGYDLIVNCTGVKAEYLANDKEVVPIRGQVLRVKAPWVFHTIMDDANNYVIPNQDTVVLGGTSQRGDYNLNPDPKDTDEILIGCAKIFPSLKTAPVIREWVGQRPGRPSIRLELHNVQTQNGKSLNIIHNYGHSGSGVTLCWGCANDVRNLVQATLQLKPYTRHSKL